MKVIDRGLYIFAQLPVFTKFLPWKSGDVSVRQAGSFCQPGLDGHWYEYHQLKALTSRGDPWLLAREAGPTVGGFLHPLHLTSFLPQ